MTGTEIIAGICKELSKQDRLSYDSEIVAFVRSLSESGLADMYHFGQIVKHENSPLDVAFTKEEE